MLCQSENKKMTKLHPTIAELQHSYRTGQETVRNWLAVTASNIADSEGEGRRVFIRTMIQDCVQVAVDQDKVSKEGTKLKPLHGIIVSIKDLFDIEGQVTTSGSMVLAKEPPAHQDCEVVSQIREAGGVIIGRTNMTEFAYSGLGINPHYGTPLNPHERTQKRIPGGSTSGGAISVADGMADVAIGTDTGGSCRIPAAFCGLVGFKPSEGRYSKQGVLPLSKTMDSVGTIARSVDCCDRVDQVLSSDQIMVAAPQSLKDLKIGVLKNIVNDGAEAQVLKALTKVENILKSSGAILQDRTSAAADQAIAIEGQPKIVSHEAYHQFKHLLETDRIKEFDQRVCSRMLRGKNVTSDVYQGTLAKRQELIGQWHQEFSKDDVWIMPTVAVVAPLLDPLLASDELYFANNALVLRNTGLFNFLDGCAISLPCQQPGELPVGVMLVMPKGRDRKLLAVAKLIESALKS